MDVFLQFFSYLEGEKMIRADDYRISGRTSAQKAEQTDLIEILSISLIGRMVELSISVDLERLEQRCEQTSSPSRPM